MPEYLTLRDGRKIELLSEEEDRRVTEAALADPDAQPWTDEDLAKVQPVRFHFSGRATEIEIVVLPNPEDEEQIKTESK